MSDEPYGEDDFDASADPDVETLDEEDLDLEDLDDDGYADDDSEDGY